MDYISFKNSLLRCLLLAVLTCIRSGSDALSSELQMISDKPTTCVYERAYGMYGVHCGGLKLTSIPKNLKTSIEILDASDNKIRELTENSFTSYTGVRYLYLADNSIYVVEENSLTPLTSMESLDLSQNAITSIPNTILHLPSLKKLDLKGNPLIHWHSTLLSLQKPITAPLQVLDISDCKLRLFPELGTLPELKSYNVSDNQLIRLLPETFAHTCQLSVVDLSRSVNNIHLCSLKPAVEWLTQNDVYFALEDYSSLNTNEFHECPDFAVEDTLNATLEQCKREIVSRPMYTPTKQTWLTVAGGLFGFVVGFMLLLYLIHRGNVAQTRNNKKAKVAKDNEEILLNPE